MSVGIIAGNVAAMSVIAQSVTPAEVAAATAVEQSVTVPGVKVGDAVIVNPPGLTAGVALVGARVSAANTVQFQFVNATAAPVTPLAGSHTITVFRFSGNAAVGRVMS
jgi:hypothetical protein